MKAVSIIVGALAAFTTAAPTKEVAPRGSFDINQFNGLNFGNQQFQYLGLVNNFDLALLQQLSINNNFNALQFSGLFSNNVFDLASLLQFQQLSTVLQLGQLGVFNQFDLSSLAFNQFNFALLQNSIGGLNLGGFIDQSLSPQLAAVIASGGE